jgi:hypothetical protein
MNAIPVMGSAGENRTQGMMKRMTIATHHANVDIYSQKLF